ncbi:ATP-binding protein [Sinanaerobacter chloroacetimidivorans]|uniref:ATP-binding protein n=1 Tax=Sinanaerobacter chloroacetimidivorans TaxID=2818044 RepID=A0A8J7W3T4_9FIRM|nr:ATP-binding protein [Sinanaerobacter chloroacetimidivorans]MBR0598415.1 ATP-binding protein [Sinanaerobacter chloroacetimidivorans]
MTDILKFSVPGKPEYVGMVRLAISSLANCAGFDIEAIEDIKVAVSEACTNVVCHGKSSCEVCYEVACEVGDDRMIISVIDQCGGYDITKYHSPVFEEDPKEGGLGIFIIKALMDEVDILSELGAGTSIKMVKYISRF